MKKIDNSVLIWSIAAVLLVLAMPAHAQVSNGGDDASPAPASSTGSGSTGSVSNGGDDAVAVSTPAAPVSGGSGASVSNGGDDAPAPAPINNGGGSFSGGGSYSFGGGGASNASATGSCPLITSYLKLGWNNDPVQVTKLQSFLKNNENLNVDVNGTFDEKTFEAVKAFQTKYVSTVMNPWSVSTPTGTVYITTLKKINQLACSQPLALNTTELATIEAYKKSLITPANLGTASTITSVGPNIIEASATSSNLEVANENAAAVGNASVMNRFWSFIKYLFQ